MKKLPALALLVVLTSCYQTLSLDGFDKERWKKPECTTYRLESADLLIQNEALLLSATQNEIESLLGKAEEHELYERNQKFFHYRLTPPDSCGSYSTKKYLTVRFNAIGRANEVLLAFRE